MSCGKDETPTPTKTNTELISQSPWKFQSAIANSIDVSSASQLACFIDNIVTFSSGPTFTINEGPIICTPSTAGTFTWSFQSGETQLQLSAPLFPGGSSTFTIVTLNSTNLVISQNVTIPPSLTPILVVFTFKH